MPRIPEYQRQRTIPGVSGSVRGGIPQSTGGELIGRAVEGFADSWGSFADTLLQRKQEMQKRDDDYAISRITSWYDDEHSTFGTQQKQLKGTDAYGGQERVKEFTAQAVKKYAEGIESPYVRERVQKHIEGRQAELKRDIALHEAIEGKRVGDQAEILKLETQMNRAYNGLGAVEENINEYVAFINTRLANKDLSPEEAALKISVGQDAIALKTINGVRARDKEAYLALIRSGVHDKYLLSDTKERLMKEADIVSAQIEDKKATDLGLNAGETIYLSKKENASLDEMLETARDQLGADTTAYRIAEMRINSLYDADRNALAEEIRQRINDVYAHITTVKLDGRIPTINDVPQEKWDALSRVAPQEANSIIEELRLQARDMADRSAQKEVQRRIEWGDTWSGLVRNTDALKTANLDRLLATGRIGKEQHNDLKQRQQDIQNGRHDPVRGAAIAFVVSDITEDHAAGVFGDPASLESKMVLARQIEGLELWSRNNPDRNPKEYYETVVRPVAQQWIGQKIDNLFYSALVQQQMDGSMPGESNSPENQYALTRLHFGGNIPNKIKDFIFKQIGKKAGPDVVEEVLKRDFELKTHGLDHESGEYKELYREYQDKLEQYRKYEEKSDLEKYMEMLEDLTSRLKDIFSKIGEEKK